MDKSIHQIVIKQEIVNDEKYKVIEIPLKNGDYVKSNSVIGCIETSKANVEIESEVNGFIYYGNFHIDDYLFIGDVFCIISPEKITNHLDIFSKSNNQSKENESKNITKPALDLIKSKNLDISQFSSFSIVTKQIVEEFLKKNSLEPQRLKELKINENSILIIGSGGHAKCCIDIIQSNKDFDILGCISKDTISSTCLEVPVIGNDDDLVELFNLGVKYAVVGIGGLSNPVLRSNIYYRLKEIGFLIPTIIHKSSSIEPSAKIADGCQIFAGSIIGSNAEIGSNCIINTGSIVSHDCNLKENVHLTPGAVLAGTVTVNKNSIIGMCSTVFFGCQIGENVIINNGVNISRNIENNSRIKGNQ